MAQILRIDHVAMVVENTDTALTFWRDALGTPLAHMDDVPAEASKVAFLPLENSEVELVAPMTADSGLAQFLEKRGPGMHHICLEVDDIDGMIAQLKEKGIRLINETPKTGAGGKKYAFVHPKSACGVLVELYELPKGN